MVTATSRASFHQLPPKQIPSESQLCLSVFERRPELYFSHRDISCATGLAVNVAQSRCSNLVKKYKIEYAGRYYDFFTKRSVQKYRLAKHKKNQQQQTSKERT